MSDDALKPFAVSIREAARLQGLAASPAGAETRFTNRLRAENLRQSRTARSPKSP